MIGDTSFSGPNNIRGQNAYITSLDFDSGKALWKNDPLVANNGDSVLVDSGLWETQSM
ncbi:MAG: hypothetical protein AAGA56_20400 [Myxococcota bacterium]